mgnify:CR=1 FL=1
MKIQLTHTFEDIVSLENLLDAWREFVVGKKGRKDVQEFQRNLMQNIIALHQDLTTKTYHHLPYEAFNISDPKPRSIHKASVRDRLLHHAIYRKLYLFFNNTFIADSYSCRLNKGTYKALDRFLAFAYQCSKNHTKTSWVLKGDIKKFFASIDQDILIKIVKDYISDKNIVWLISNIVESFHSIKEKVGLPLGNLTSQLLVNIYMNKFDQFVKHTLKVKYYIRYADDFVILSQDKKCILSLLPKINDFLWNELRLQLHPDKVSIRTFASGIDFLGWAHFPNHRVLRTTTKHRMMKRLMYKKSEQTIQSYLGLLDHGNTHKIREQIITNQ